MKESRLSTGGSALQHAYAVVAVAVGFAAVVDVAGGTKRHCRASILLVKGGTGVVTDGRALQKKVNGKHEDEVTRTNKKNKFNTQKKQ